VSSLQIHCSFIAFPFSRAILYDAVMEDPSKDYTTIDQESNYESSDAFQ
jgi:hypothetical protein